MLFENNTKCLFDKKDLSYTDKNIKLKTKNRIDFTRDNARILSCDKVNRQLFESEVQLINALQNMKFKGKKTLKQSENINIKNLNASSIELVDLDEKNTLNLPDNIKSTKTNSELISQILEIRKNKFSKFFAEFYQILGSINKKTESMINGLCQNLNTDLLAIDTEMESQLQIINSSNLNNLIRENFHHLNNQREFAFNKQKSLIENNIKNILLLESDRVIILRNLLLKSSTEIIRIGHLAPSEVHRIMNSILIEINLSIIDNKESFHDLKTKLLMHVIDKNRKTQIYLNNQLTIWQKIMLNLHLDGIKNKIEKETTEIPTTIKSCISDLNDLVSKLSIELQELFPKIITEMQPDVCNEKTIENWISFLISMKNKFNEGCDNFVKESYGKLEFINQKCMNKIDFLKATILAENIYDDKKEISNIIDNLCLPLLGKFHSNFEKDVNEIEIIIEQTCENLDIRIRDIDKFLKNLWNIWKIHETDLKKTEDGIYLKVNSSIALHQEQNILIENELNIMVDKMRQDSSEQSLKEDLKKCLNILDKIKTSYTNFFNQQANAMRKYPSLVESDVKRFEEKIINYFANYYSGGNSGNENLSTEDQQSHMSNDEVSRIIESSMLHITDGQCLDLVKGIENNFKNFIQKWNKIVEQNASKLVAVKIDEFNGELKLRFHLHEPRYKRIEYDVHNVRSTELIIHSERVSKQCKGIESSLNNILEDYNALEKSHKLKQEQFKEKITSDEEAFLTVTNNSKLVNMKKVFEDKNNEYMNDLRVTMRDFRKNVEIKLQKLRQTNSDFIRSFKLFSVGGNFSVEEIDDFSKKIEKANKRIDDVEGEIMSNLEVVEKQQQDALIQFQNMFEEKFKFHIIDINFMDKLNRAFAFIQLKIKTEVSNSNSQSRIIFENIKNLQQEFIEQSKLRKDQKTYIQISVFESIVKSFNCIHNRCIYLDCIKSQSNPKLKSNNLEINDGINQNKVQFSAITVISKGGRQPNEDQGLKTIKSLLQIQNSYIGNQNDQIEKFNKFKDKGMSQSDTKLTQNGNISRSLSVVSGSVASDQKPSNEKSKLVNKNQRLEKKYLVFGDETPEITQTFLSKIKAFSKEVLDGILYAAELYYRNKGVRKVTHSSLQESFDQAAEDIIFKLKFYFQQAEDYYKECLNEFNRQLLELENVINSYPEIMFSIMLDKILFECVHSLEEAERTQLEMIEMISLRKNQYYSELRSDFGQPSKLRELNNICDNEMSRQNEEMELIVKSYETNNDIVYSYGRQFAKIITDATEQYLLLMDNILTTADIQISETKEEPMITKDLIRLRMNGPTKNLVDSKSITNFIKTSWTSDDIREILLSDKNNKKFCEEILSKSLINAKHTSCHDTIILERSKTVEKFKKFYFEKLEHHRIVKDRRSEELRNYKTFWNDSINSLQMT